MSKQLFEEMVKRAITTVEDVWKLNWSDIDIFSGGAAWSGTMLYSFQMSISALLTIDT